MSLLDIAQTAVHGELLQPIWYVPFVGHYALLAGVGLIVIGLACSVVGDLGLGQS